MSSKVLVAIHVAEYKLITDHWPVTPVTTVLTKRRWLTSNEHGDDGEEFFGVGVCWHITEADTSKAGAREIQSWDIGCHSDQIVQWLVNYWSV